MKLKRTATAPEPAPTLAELQAIRERLDGLGAPMEIIAEYDRQIAELGGERC